MTRRKEHLDNNDGLDQDKLRLNSFDTMPVGSPIDAIITYFTPTVQHSCPVAIQVSPFIHSQLNFSDCFDVKSLQPGTDILKYASMRFKVGDAVKVVYYADGHFVLASVANANKSTKPNGAKDYAKGDLVLVRFVKSLKSFGITV